MCDIGVKRSMSGRVGGLIRANRELREKLYGGRGGSDNDFEVNCEIEESFDFDKPMMIMKKTLIKMQEAFDSGYDIVINTDPHMHLLPEYESFDCKRISVSSDRSGVCRRIIWSVKFKRD